MTKTTLYSVAQVAEELGVHRSRVAVLIKEGRIEASKVGNQWVIESGSLDAVRNRQTGRPIDSLPAGYLTVSEAAKELELSAARIYQMIASGKLPAKKVGKRYAISASHLRRDQ